jgi:hypothetical protein
MTSSFSLGGSLEKTVIPSVAFVFLTGCWGDDWDAAAERAGCETIYPGDQKKIEDCYTQKKLAYDRERAKLGEAAKR